MEAGRLERLIRRCLADFYSQRIEALDKLDLTKVLRRKNPYLFRAAGIANAPEMINQLLAAHVSSSDETIFGATFFEPICKAVSRSHIAAAPGVDFVIETGDSFKAISLKSGPNAFNSSQVSKQNQQFDEMQRSLRATLSKIRKQFVPIMGCAYGSVDKEPTNAQQYYKLAGQTFWQSITGDPEFYLKLIRLMRDDPDMHRRKYKEAWDRAINRFVGAFAREFCNRAGDIQWEKLVQFNSGRKPSGCSSGSR